MKKSNNDNTNYILIAIICALVGITSFFIVSFPVIILKAYISDLINIDLFYGTIFYDASSHSDWRGLVCCSAPFIAAFFSSLVGVYAAKRTEAENRWIYAVISAGIVGALYAFLPCGAFYPSTV